MKTRILNVAVVAVFAVAMIATSQPSVAGDSGQWYFSPMLQYLEDDAGRFTDPGYGLHLGLGHKMGRNWALEGTFTGNEFNGGVDYRQYGIGLDLIKMFGDGSVKPYVLAGIGYLDSDVSVGDLGGPAPDDYTNEEAHIGLGLAFPVGKRNYMRSDLRYRRDFASSSAPINVDLDDWVFNIGMAMPLGKGKEKVVDTDGDGVADNADKCPSTPAGMAVNSMGCERDSDGDGVADSKDRCPGTAAGTKVDSKGCKVKAADSDRDGVSDKMDRCPSTPAGATVDNVGCELDSDNDGVVDRRDRCPNSDRGARVDIYGCEIKAKISLPGVNFETNSAKLTASSTSELNAAAETLKKNSDLKVEAAGHTDSAGAADYNRSLSQKRAEAVRDHLISKGANGDNISARGYGEDEPVADNSTKEGRSRNRRVELKILN
ncbi:MAG: OmpA family protein [Gammaproteobacteria bacterium]|nr:OmpA family protein [Gammaproteobacteria bacterium]